MRYLSLALMVVGLVGHVDAQSLASNGAAIRLIARLAPQAQITSIVRQGGIGARQIAPERMVLEVPAGETATINFDFRTNTRAVLIKANAVGASATLDVAPLVTTCDWVHSEIVVEEGRTVASLTACKPSKAQRASIRIGPRTETVTLTITVEPGPT